MEENQSGKILDETSFQATVALLDNFSHKKLYFEETIGKLKKFQPTSLSPSPLTNTNINKQRTSTRLTTKNDNNKGWANLMFR